jgi:hypothetical protein
MVKSGNTGSRAALVVVSSKAVKRFWILQAIVIVTCIVILLVHGSADAGERVLGYRAVCTDATEVDPCWLSAGGWGGITLGAGVGVVSYGWLSAGILFGVGQAACGLIAFGQVAVGPVFFCAQLGAGLTGLGQLAIGGRVMGQGELGFDGHEFLGDLNARLNELLRFRS